MIVIPKTSLKKLGLSFGQIPLKTEKGWSKIM